MKKHKKLTKKQYWFLMLTSIILVVFAFGFLVVGAIYQDKGQDINPVIIIVGFFGLMGIALAILFINLKCALHYEFEAKANQMKQMGYKEINDVWPNKLIEALHNKKFKFVDGEFHKKQFSFWKDIINYYVKVVDCNDISESIQKETKYINHISYKGNFICNILCLVKDFVNDEDLEKLLVFNQIRFASESTRFSKYSGRNTVLILLDRFNSKLYYYSSGKNSITLYYYGIKLIEKLLKD